MTEQGQAFAPLASSKDTLAMYKNPFGFSLQVIESATHITLGAGGVDAAQVSISLHKSELKFKYNLAQSSFGPCEWRRFYGQRCPSTAFIPESDVEIRKRRRIYSVLRRRNRHRFCDCTVEGNRGCYC
jgi:hypothetical protein